MHAIYDIWHYPSIIAMGEVNMSVVVHVHTVILTHIIVHTIVLSIVL